MSTLDFVLTHKQHMIQIWWIIWWLKNVDLTQSGLNCTLICIKQNKSRGLRGECICVHSEYSTLSWKCKSVGECFACLLVLSRKRHTKNTGGKKVQFNELFYYYSLDKPSARFPHTDKKHMTTSDSEFYRKCIIEVYKQQQIGKTALIHLEYRSIHKIQSKKIHLHK